jgi:apolipoprotein N-acyltransferase
MLSWLHNYLEIPMSGFSSGGKNQPDLLIGNVPIAPFICYEIAYADIVLDYLPRAGLLVTVCDDSWFGESIALAQHLEIARMRSLEVGRYQLLSTNTGITAIIDANGKIVAQLPTFKQAVLTADIQLLSGATPWVKLCTIIKRCI